MMDFAEVKVALRSQESGAIKKVIARYLQTNDAAVERILGQIFYLAAQEDLSIGKPLGIVYMDSVRDLLTLYEEPDADPSLLLNTAIDYFSTLRLREFDKSLTTLQPEDMGQILMVEDLVSNIRAGHREKALREATKLLWTMDNVFYLVEILTELAASVADKNIFPMVLAGAVLKSTDYVTSAQRNPIIFMLTDYLTTQDFTDITISSMEEIPAFFDNCYATVINSRDIFTDELIYLTYAHQIWESVRMKAESIQPLIIQSLQQKFGPTEHTEPTQIKPVAADIPEILQALKNDDAGKSQALLFGYGKADKGLGTLYRHLADLAFESITPKNPMDLILFNAYRTTLTYVEPPLQNHVLVRAGGLVREIIHKG